MPAPAPALAIDTGEPPSIVYGPAATEGEDKPVGETKGADMESDPGASSRDTTPRKLVACAVTCQPAPVPLGSLTEYALRMAVVVWATPLILRLAKSPPAPERY